MFFSNPFLWFLDSFELRLVAGLFLFSARMPHRDYFYVRALVFLPLLFGNFIFHIFGIDLLSVLRVGWFSFMFLIEFVLGLAAVAFCFKIDYRRILYVGTGAYSFQNAVNALYFFFLFHFELFGNEWTIALYLGILISFWLLVYFGIIRQKWYITSARMNPLPLAISIAGSLGILMVYSSYLTFASRSGSQIHMNQFIISVLIITVLILIICHNTRVLEKEILERLLIEKGKEYRVTQESINLINQKSHDLKKMVAFIKAHAQDDVLDEANSIEETIKKYDSIVQTGNEVVDICLSEKMLFCRTNGINFSCVVDGALLSKMNSVDIYTFLSNALDNAIEAVMLIEDEDKRNIALNISRQGDMARIRLENSYLKEPVFVSGLPITTKSNKKYHGFGVQSIKTTIKKYGGFFDCFTESGKFILLATLPL